MTSEEEHGGGMRTGFAFLRHNVTALITRLEEDAITALSMLLAAHMLAHGKGCILVTLHQL